MWSVLSLAGSLAVIGCRSNNKAQQTPPAKPPAKVAADASEDPCKDTPTGDVCREDLPVANPVTLANGRVRAVFEEEADQKNRSARCRVVDFTRSGEEAVATGCCERGHVVATALDESDRFYVLCQEGVLLDDTHLVARRFDADGTFRNFSSTSTLVPSEFGPGVDPQGVAKHRLIVANGSTWLIHDLSKDTGGKELAEQTYVQATRDNAKPIEIDASFAAAYVANATLFVITAYDDANGGTYRFYQLAADRAVRVEEPAGA